MKQRNVNLDIIRCVAVLFVLSVHALSDLGFYDFTCTGKRMLVLCMLRVIFMSCVPLFMMLTGYLMNQKTLSLKYYKGINEYYGAAEPPVRCGVSHLSGLTEPPVYSYSA
jgi:surface polysaccharide O-acyltransferase-like enzyme